VRIALTLAAALALMAPLPASAEPAEGARSAREGWVVSVALRAGGLGPVEVAVGPLRPAPPNNSYPWLEHELVITNTADRPITFADTRTVRILDGLLVAEEGCGYALRPLEPACLLYLDIPSLPPGDSRSRTVTLWKGLPGLQALEPGTYVFRKVLRFAFGRAAPGPGTGARAVVRLVYRVEAS
jgi:hypothetical protein